MSYQSMDCQNFRYWQFDSGVRSFSPFPPICWWWLW